MNHRNEQPLGIDPPERTGQVRLADGRRLAWAEWGPDDAPALLFCPGAATSRRLGFSTHVLHDHRARLVSVDRPGLGSSDPHPARTLLDWAEDITQLRDQRQLRLAGTIGFSQGAPFALACAHAGLVPAVAIVSGTDELAAPSLRDLLPQQVQGLIQLVAEDPAAAEAAFAGVGDAVTMRRLVHQMSAAQDLELYTRNDFDHAFRQALGEGFQQGPAGYARDSVLSMSPWPFPPEEIPSHVQLWYGALDTSPVHSPDFGELLSERLPQCTRRVLPDNGASLLWTHGETICRDLLT